MLKDKKILITGVTGTATLPIAEFLAKNNDVWGVARFTDKAARNRLESQGVKTLPIDLTAGDLSGLPQDFTHLMLCAHTRLDSGEFSKAIQLNAVSAGRVMQHCAGAEAAIVFSSGSVYSFRDDDLDGSYAYKEGDDIGRAFPIWGRTSPMAKASLEAVARFCAEAFNIRTTIARLNIVYGSGYGMPFMDADALWQGKEIVSFADPYPVNPIHSDDMCHQIEALYDAASTPALIVNWCGDDIVTRHGWIERAALLSGKAARVRLAPAPGTPLGSVLDGALRRSITGPCRVRFAEAFDHGFKERYSNKD